MNLIEFDLAQKKFVEHFANQLRRLEELGYFDPFHTNRSVEQSINRLKQTSPWLKGVTVREVLKEIDSPGSFRGITK